MGLDTLQPNLVPWIRRVHADADFILGRRPDTQDERRRAWMASGVIFTFPSDAEERYREIAKRIYDLFSPPGKAIPGKRTLLDLALLEVAGFPVRITCGSPGLEDSGFLYFKTEDADSPHVVARLYVHFPHDQFALSRGFLCATFRLLASNPHLIPQAKIAGPGMNPERKDSLLFFLTVEGLKRVEALQNGFATVRDALKEGSIPGSLELEKGIGLAMEPRPVPASGSWKSKFMWADASFGTLLAAYLAEALDPLCPTLDAYADRICELMAEDGIDPGNVWRLSRATRDWREASPTLQRMQRLVSPKGTESK